MPRRDMYDQDDGGVAASPFNMLKIIGNSRSLTLLYFTLLFSG